MEAPVVTRFVDLERAANQPDRFLEPALWPSTSLAYLTSESAGWANGDPIHLDVERTSGRGQRTQGPMHVVR